MMICLGQFKNGKWESEDSTALTDYKSKYDSVKSVMEIKPWKPQRSLRQNSYMWGVVYQTISNYTGMTPNEVHEFCKMEFNFGFKEVLNKNTGELKEMKYPKSTKELTTGELENYLESIRRYFLTEVDLMVPLPNEIF